MKILKLVNFRLVRHDLLKLVGYAIGEPQLTLNYAITGFGCKRRKYKKTESKIIYA